MSKAHGGRKRRGRFPRRYEVESGQQRSEPVHVTQRATDDVWTVILSKRGKAVSWAVARTYLERLHPEIPIDRWRVSRNSHRTVATCARRRPPEVL